MKKIFFKSMLAIFAMLALVACGNTPEEPQDDYTVITVDHALNYLDDYGEGTTDFFFAGMDDGMAANMNGRNFYFDVVCEGECSVPKAGHYVIATTKEANTMVAAFQDPYIGVWQGCYCETWENGEKVEGAEIGYTEGYMDVTEEADRVVCLIHVMENGTEKVYKAVILNSQWTKVQF